VSRAVIRKALGRLAHMRLLNSAPIEGAVVASPTVDEARDPSTARRAIEGRDRVGARIAGDASSCASSGR
jgi:DNA-binding GntR family transcriptional regulator